MLGILFFEHMQIFQRLLSTGELGCQVFSQIFFPDVNFSPDVLVRKFMLWPLASRVLRLRSRKAVVT